MHLVRTGSAAGIEQLLKSLGQNPITLIESVGLRHSQFRDPDQYIDYHKLANLLSVCSEACNAPNFGFLLAQTQTISVLGDLPMLSSRARTVGEAIQAINRSLYLHASSVALNTELKTGMAYIRLSIDIGEPRGMSQLMQLSVAHAALYISELLNASAYSQVIHLSQSAPLVTSSNLCFNSVRYGQAFDGISLSRDLLQRSPHRDERALNKHLDGYLSRLQALYPDNLERQVSDVIGRMLPCGECSIENVAATLNLHPRTLQERLRVLGSCYRNILQQKRYDLATAHLARADSAITELALQLGYAEVSVFSRHFKEWSGLSPRAWRKAKLKRS